MDFAEMDSLLETYRQRGYYPSAVCQVFDREKTLYHRAVGDVSPDTWFDLASVSKIICTTMLLCLMDEGRLSPESPVLPYFPEAGEVTRRRLAETTVERLMTHTSGIVPWFPFYTDGRDFFTVLERVLSTTPVEQGMAYSDINFMLLGLLFSRISGLSLREGLQTYLRAGMGVDEIAYGPVDASLCAPSCYGNQIEKRMCAERGLSFDGWREDGVPVCGTCNDGNTYYYWKGVSGLAGVFATSRALTRLCQYYMRTDKPAFLRAMDTNVYGRGLGFDRSNVFPDGCGHTGFTGTSLYFSRAHNIGAVLLTNKFFRREGTPGNTQEFRRAVHYALLGRVPPETV
ncbi:MAG: serine hydrolase domain-containing protein [Christensenellales bacterium]|nr:serine hydrolase domain-containing protein [Christensenellales bacterium]